MLGFGLQRQQPPELPLDLGAVRACLAEEHQDLVVVLAGGTQPEAGAAHGVGRVDAGVDGEAGGSDVAAGFEVAGGGLGELLGLRRIGADLGG